MTLLVRAPSTFAPERRYVLDTVLSEWLGLEFELEAGDVGQVVIRFLGDASERELTLPDVLFGTPPGDWLTNRSLPAVPLITLDAGLGTDPRPAGGDDRTASPRGASLPVIFGTRGADSRWWSATERGLALRVDIFGSAFFALTLYEENVRREVDEHERYPAPASLASTHGFLQRPLIDEYVELLWIALRALWPSIARRPTRFILRLTHDVDRPWAVLGRNALSVGRGLAADLVRRGDTALAVQRIRAVVEARSGRVDHDPYNTFDFLMDTSERVGIRSTFFFMAGGDVRGVDATYDLADPLLADLLRRVHQRGHEVGLHASYQTFRSTSGMRRELEDLKTACHVVGFEQAAWGVRQHFLRFAVPETWRIQANAGLDYDSTVGFAKENGFRAGTCREYPVFDLTERRELALRERPLVMMEVASPEFLAHDLEGAAAKALALVAECRRLNGQAVLLYHNSSLPSSRQRAHYRDLVEAIVQGR
jgi:hypothetical protein